MKSCTLNAVECICYRYTIAVFEVINRGMVTRLVNVSKNNSTSLARFNTAVAKLPVCSTIVNFRP